MRPYVASDALNAGTRKRRRSISGSGRTSCRLTNMTPSATPTRIDRIAVASIPLWAIRLRPKIMASTATNDIAALARSGFPALGSLYSGRNLGQPASSSAITGTLMRKTEPHQKNCSNNAADQRADRAADRIAHDPDADRHSALVLVEEHVADQRERRRSDRCSGDTEQRACRDQHSGAGRERGQHRRDRRTRRRRSTGCGAGQCDRRTCRP